MAQDRFWDVSGLAEKEGSNWEDFPEAIGRPDLKEVISASSPWVSVSMEVACDGLSFTGGMGVLEGDKLLQAEKLGIYYVSLTLAYSKKWSQKIEGLRQRENWQDLTPEDQGFKRIGKINIQVNDDTVELDICRKQLGTGCVIALYEPGLREVYYGSNSSEHRLYQQVVLGFGGLKALRELNLSPSVLHLNESSKVFSAVAFLDEAVSRGMNFKDALEHTRRNVVLTNHTFVPASVSLFPRELYERYVFTNIENQEVRNWLRAIIEKEGQVLNLSTLALELAGKLNGVSKMHSRIADAQFQKQDGSRVHFEAITNGIFLQRWAHRQYLALYQTTGIINPYDLPGEGYGKLIENLDSEELKNIKMLAKREMHQYLGTRLDQYDKAVEIPENAQVAVWARRMAGYKRPGMLFKDPALLSQILESRNMHLITAGKAHPTDESMKEELSRILAIVDNSPVFRSRVHFVQDYDVELAQHLLAGADIWLNTPEGGQEACGTSPWKAIVNGAIVVSAKDGGMADIEPPSYMVIAGNNYQEEVDSLYWCLDEAAKEVTNTTLWGQRIKGQLKDYLPIVSGGRMMADYINFIDFADQRQVETLLVKVA